MRVRVDPRTRRAAPQALFNQEEGDARLTFTFTATCLHPTAQDEDDAALLVAAARMVRHLGAARRRGRGECRITLLKADGLPGGKDWTQEKVLFEFKLRWLECTSPVKAKTSEELIKPEKQTRNLIAASVAGERLRFRLIARADEPVIVAKRSEAANAYESLLTIPGTPVLGALASQAARALGLKMDESAPPDFIALFARGDVRVTGLSLAQKDARADRLYPSIPMPRDSFICEVNPKHPMIHFASIGKPPADPRCGDCSAAMIEWIKTAPLVTVRRQPQPVQPQQREEAHITLNRKTGRVLTGNLYEYIALEAGQWFTGEIECANEACWLALQDLLGLGERKTLQIRLGKATQRGYGLLTFFMTRMDENAPSSW
jgi:CRISPR-associated protein Csx10